MGAVSLVCFDKRVYLRGIEVAGNNAGATQ